MTSAPVDTVEARARTLAVTSPANTFLSPGIVIDWVVSAERALGDAATESFRLKSALRDLLAVTPAVGSPAFLDIITRARAALFEAEGRQ